MLNLLGIKCLIYQLMYQVMGVTRIEQSCTDRERLFYRLHVLIKEMDQAFTSAVSTSCTKLEMMGCLHQRAELSQLELQRLLGLDAAAVTRHLKQLKQQQLIACRKHDQDKRISLVSLTDKGEAELMELTAKRKQFLEQLTADLSDADIAVLHAFIERISRNIR